MESKQHFYGCVPLFQRRPLSQCSIYTSVSHNIHWLDLYVFGDSALLLCLGKLASLRSNEVARCQLPTVPLINPCSILKHSFWYIEFERCPSDLLSSHHMLISWYFFMPIATHSHTIIDILHTESSYEAAFPAHPRPE